MMFDQCMVCADDGLICCLKFTDMCFDCRFGGNDDDDDDDDDVDACVSDIYK